MNKKFCLGCKKEFIPTYQNRKYCSNICKEKLKKQNTCSYLHCKEKATHKKAKRNYCEFHFNLLSGQKISPKKFFIFIFALTFIVTSQLNLISSLSCPSGMIPTPQELNDSSECTTQQAINHYYNPLKKEIINESIKTELEINQEEQSENLLMAFNIFLILVFALIIFYLIIERSDF